MQCALDFFLNLLVIYNSSCFFVLLFSVSLYLISFYVLCLSEKKYIHSPETIHSADLKRDDVVQDCTNVKKKKKLRRGSLLLPCVCARACGWVWVCACVSVFALYMCSPAVFLQLMGHLMVICSTNKL